MSLDPKSSKELKIQLLVGLGIIVMAVLFWLTPSEWFGPPLDWRYFLLFLFLVYLPDVIRVLRWLPSALVRFLGREKGG